MTSIFEIMELSLLFAFTAVPIMLLVFVFYVGLCLSKKRKISFLFHWMDILIPFITTVTTYLLIGLIEGILFFFLFALH